MFPAYKNLSLTSRLPFAATSRWGLSVERFCKQTDGQVSRLLQDAANPNGYYIELAPTPQSLGVTQTFFSLSRFEGKPRRFYRFLAEVPPSSTTLDVTLKNKEGCPAIFVADPNFTGPIAHYTKVVASEKYAEILQESDIVDIPLPYLAQDSETYAAFAKLVELDRRLENIMAILIAVTTAHATDPIMNMTHLKMIESQIEEIVSKFKSNHVQVNASLPYLLPREDTDFNLVLVETWVKKLKELPDLLQGALIFCVQQRPGLLGCMLATLPSDHQARSQLALLGMALGTPLDENI